MYIHEYPALECNVYTSDSIPEFLLCRIQKICCKASISLTGYHSSLAKTAMDRFTLSSNVKTLNFIQTNVLN